MKLNTKLRTVGILLKPIQEWSAHLNRNAIIICTSPTLISVRTNHDTQKSTMEIIDKTTRFTWKTQIGKKMDKSQKIILYQSMKNTSCESLSENS